MFGSQLQIYNKIANSVNIEGKTMRVVFKAWMTHNEY